MNTVVPFTPRTGSARQLPVRLPRAVYTVAEVAHLLGLSRTVTYELVRDGTIPAQRVGRRLVIPRVRFDAWLAGTQDAG